VHVIVYFFSSRRKALNMVGHLILHAFGDRPKQSASRAGGTAVWQAAARMDYACGAAA
jgi:hypothetical protein